MTVKIGSARIDEHGAIHGGAAGDQTGREVATQDWYRHGQGWVVLRPLNKTVANKIATAMERACANNNIGYDQYQRGTLYAAAAKVGFDPGAVRAAVETDCSALVRVCLAYAGIKVGDFNTANEAATLMATGQFKKLTAAKYTTSPDWLERGDVLVTKTQGHTVVVLNNGAKVPQPAPAPVKPAKTVEQIAQEVIDGKWGNGADRKKKLAAAGYDYAAVQAAVNRLVAAQPVYYTIQRGDTLSTIARKYGTAVQRIAALNGIRNVNRIVAGHRIRVK